jgi:hypothetical protein
MLRSHVGIPTEVRMDGLMMDYPLTITAMLRRTEAMFGFKEIVSRRADRSIERSKSDPTMRRR